MIVVYLNDADYQVCLPIVAAENWKPATKTEQVIQSLVNLVNDPEPEHPLRADLAGKLIKTSTLLQMMRIL